MIKLSDEAITRKRAKVYAKRMDGRFRRVRTSVSLLLQGLLFLLPWATWEGRQAVLIDIPGRKLYLPGMVLFPQETFFLLILLISGGLTLFASTAIAGRMWCGYACPQTLFTQTFMMVERWIEGDRARRMRLDKGPWTAEKVLRRTLKLAAWTGMGVWLGITFAGYFTPIRELVPGILRAQPTTWALVGFFTAISLFDFGWFREQFCHYLCPYARFQGAMFDQDSLIVGYDEKRGEPRGKSAGGECVDCNLCVQ
ncbi:MAG: 4Fe-4S dicluster domain-containing protein, partial [Candidatus Eremiobacterota bacterium]